MPPAEARLVLMGTTLWDLSGQMFKDILMFVIKSHIKKQKYTMDGKQSCGMVVSKNTCILSNNTISTFLLS